MSESVKFERNTADVIQQLLLLYLISFFLLVDDKCVTACHVVSRMIIISSQM